MKATWFLLLLLLPADPVRAGKNFVASGADQIFCRRVEEAAEAFRQQHAIDWLQKPLPGDWFRPCPIRVVLGVRQGGATSFSFDGGQVGGWDMMVSGDADEILTRVLPHEVLHSVFASHFRRKLPRWADEGACVTVEHPDERRRSDQMLRGIFREGRVMPINRLLTLTEYPDDVLPLYWQGHSVVSYLLTLGDRPTFVRFLETALAAGNWSTALETCYSIAGPQVLEQKWRCFAIPPANQPGSPLPLTASAANADKRLVADRSNQVAAAGLPRILQPCFRDQQSGPPPQPYQPQPAEQPYAPSPIQQPAITQPYNPWNNFQLGAPRPAEQPPVVPAPAITSSTPDPEPPPQATPAATRPLVAVAVTSQPAPPVATAGESGASTPNDAPPYRGEGSQDGKQNAGGWFSSLGETLGGGAGLAAGVIVTSLLAGMGIPPVVSKLGGALARRVATRAGTKVAGDLDAQFAKLRQELDGRFHELGQQAGQADSDSRFAKLAGDIIGHVNDQLSQLAAKARTPSPIVQTLVSPPEVRHSNQFVSYPDNREGKAYQEAIARLGEQDFRKRDLYRELNRVKDLILTSQEPSP